MTEVSVDLQGVGVCKPNTQATVDLFISNSVCSYSFSPNDSSEGKIYCFVQILSRSINIIHILTGALRSRVNIFLPSCRPFSFTYFSSYILVPGNHFTWAPISLQCSKKYTRIWSSSTLYFASFIYLFFSSSLHVPHRDSRTIFHLHSSY